MKDDGAYHQSGVPDCIMFHAAGRTTTVLTVLAFHVNSLTNVSSFVVDVLNDVI